MKKYINIAFIYALTGMAAGVFYREFTKFADFSGRTTLAFMHPHLLLLGMVMFLLVALFANVLPIEQLKRFKVFMVLYNMGLVLTVVMLLVRGIFQVQGAALSRGVNASLSGLAGTGHILLGTGLILFLLCLKKAARKN